jgi:hypothetical protein
MKKIIIALIAVCIATSCNDFVDVIPKGNTIPETVDDLAKLMNLGTLTSSYNFTEISYSAQFCELLSDDFTITQDPTQPYYIYNTVPLFANSMKWADPEENSDMKWNGLYKSNYIANYVLDQIDLAEDGVTYERDEVKGRALVQRALNYFILVNLYGKAYDASPSSTSSSDPGVPLILESNINKQYPRSTVSQVYEQILDDLTQAIALMNINVPEYSNIPGLAAAYALRARVHLWMQNYNQAYDDASTSLTIKGDLIDYNTCFQAVPAYGSLAGIVGYPTPAAINPEVLLARYKSETVPVVYTDKMLAITDTENDLRYTLFSYFQAGVLQLFFNYHNHSGLNTGEVWLTKAEAALRKTNPDIQEAIAALDYVRVNRIKTEAYEPTTETNPDLLLEEILKERRREVRLTEMAFFDRKRLNVDPETASPMSRTVMGVEYTLPVGDPRYQLLIPNEVMQFNKLLVQNDR